MLRILNLFPCHTRNKFLSCSSKWTSLAGKRCQIRCKEKKKDYMCFTHIILLRFSKEDSCKFDTHTLEIDDIPHRVDRISVLVKANLCRCKISLLLFFLSSWALHTFNFECAFSPHSSIIPILILLGIDSKSISIKNAGYWSCQPIAIAIINSFRILGQRYEINFILYNDGHSVALHGILFEYTNTQQHF